MYTTRQDALKMQSPDPPKPTATAKYGVFRFYPNSARATWTTSSKGKKRTHSKVTKGKYNLGQSTSRHPKFSLRDRGRMDRENEAARHTKKGKKFHGF